MVEVKVFVTGKDKKAGALVKALAVEDAGFKSVSGARKDFLSSNGYYLFHFRRARQAEEFKKDVRNYLAEYAQVEN